MMSDSHDEQSCCCKLGEHLGDLADRLRKAVEPTKSVDQTEQEVHDIADELQRIGEELCEPDDEDKNGSLRK